MLVVVEYSVQYILEIEEDLVVLTVTVIRGWREDGMKAW